MLSRSDLASLKHPRSDMKKYKVIANGKVKKETNNWLKATQRAERLKKNGATGIEIRGPEHA